MFLNRARINKDRISPVPQIVPIGGKVEEASANQQAHSGVRQRRRHLRSNTSYYNRRPSLSALFGESFVFGELFKHTTSADVDYRLLNYRDADKFEVDIVIENMGGQLVGVEVKASATVRERDLRGLKKLASLAGDQYTAGVLL